MVLIRLSLTAFESILGRVLPPPLTIAALPLTTPDPAMCLLSSSDFDGYADALPEICANGLRNPFRCSFDRADDTLYCGDVGHALVEEIDIVE